mgnify:CR=1 FL=1
MKKSATIAILALALNASASAYFDNITNLWYTAQHSNVLAIANQRLAANTNDVAGWFMRASYDFVYADAATQSNSLDRVLSAYLSVNTPAYRQSCFFLDADVAGIKRWLSHETPAQHAETLEKGSRPGRLPHYIRQLKALDDDGYFDRNP